MGNKPLAGKRILLVNDDGINAPGMQVLENVAATLSDDVWVVAPDSEQSGKGHALTLTEPLRIREAGERRFSVNGTPTDSVVMAVRQVLKNVGQPDLILSGVNRGANLAEDVTYSGTVSAAMEGVLMHVPSIALSQHIDRSQPVKWHTAEHYAADLIVKLYRAGWDAKTLVNINFPDLDIADVKGARVTTLGMPEGDPANIEERMDPRGNPYYWIGLRPWGDDWSEDCDVAAIREGYISVTPVELDLTARSEMQRLNAALVDG